MSSISFIILLFLTEIKSCHLIKLVRKIIIVAVIYKLRKEYAFYLRSSIYKCKFKLQTKIKRIKYIIALLHYYIIAITSVSHVFLPLRHVETGHRGEAANKISLLKDLSGRKGKNQGGGRNGRKN